MAAVSAQSVTSAALVTPTTITAASSDTIAEGQFGPNGVLMTVTTAGTLTNVSIVDPNLSAMGNPATSASLATPATGVRFLYIPRSAIAQATQLATVTFSSLTGPVTYTLVKV